MAMASLPPPQSAKSMNPVAGKRRPTNPVPVPQGANEASPRRKMAVTAIRTRRMLPHLLSEQLRPTIPPPNHRVPPPNQRSARGRQRQGPSVYRPDPPAAIRMETMLPPRSAWTALPWERRADPPPSCADFPAPPTYPYPNPIHTHARCHRHHPARCEEYTQEGRAWFQQRWRQRSCERVRTILRHRPICPTSADRAQQQQHRPRTRPWRQHRPRQLRRFQYHQAASFWQVRRAQLSCHLLPFCLHNQRRRQLVYCLHNQRGRQLVYMYRRCG